MTVLIECPICKKYLSLKRKACKCGADLDKLKKQKEKIRYWIQYRMPDGRQRKEYSGHSIEVARAGDGKRKAQKKEGRILDMLPESKITFNELTEWFLALPKKKKLAYYEVLKINLKSFNQVFGDKPIKDIEKEDLENYQIQRQEQGKSASYIDQEIGAASGMIKEAWDNNKVSGDSLKPFKKVNKLLTNKEDNARDRVLSMEEFRLLFDALPYHARNIFLTGFFTGMRMGEITSLRWNQVFLKERKIDLEPEQTKDKEKRVIPIPDMLFKTLENIPRALHDDHVFLYKGKPLKSIRASLKKACEGVGIPYGRNTKNGITPHDLRHTFNTFMRKSGVHDTVIMKITGHSTREMFDRYNTVDQADQIEAAKIFEEFLFAKPDVTKEG